MAPSPFRSRRRTDRGSAPRGDEADRLSRVPPVPHDPDERPTREDLQPHGSQLFQDSGAGSEVPYATPGAPQALN